MTTTWTLPTERRHFPPTDGRYAVTAGLRALSGPYFELDERYFDYLEAKDAARRREGNLLLVDGLQPGLARAVADFALAKLPEEWPAAFRVAGDVFENTLLGLTATIDRDAMAVTGATWAGTPRVYADVEWAGMPLLDFLPLMTQEDWAISREEMLVMCHVSMPNHWRPTDKIGKDFLAVHKPVAGFAPLAKAAPQLIAMTIDKGPWERAVWDPRPDGVLDRHPAVPPAVPGPIETWWFRTERQVLHGFPEHRGMLFLIRTFVRRLTTMDETERTLLAKAVAGMAEDSAKYKGLAPHREAIVAYLTSGS